MMILDWGWCGTPLLTRWSLVGSFTFAGSPMSTAESLSWAAHKPSNPSIHPSIIVHDPSFIPSCISPEPSPASPLHPASPGSVTCPSVLRPRGCEIPNFSCSSVPQIPPFHPGRQPMICEGPHSASTPGSFQTLSPLPFPTPRPRTSCPPSPPAPLLGSSTPASTT